MRLARWLVMLMKISIHSALRQGDANIGPILSYLRAWKEHRAVSLHQPDGGGDSSRFHRAARGNGLRNRRSAEWILTFVRMTKWVWVALFALPLAGCGGVLDPQGPVGASEKLVLLDALAIMLVIVVPTILATFAFAWWFRAGNTRARYRPDWAFSGKLELIVWAIPVLVITFLGGIAWFGSHTLDPYAPLPSKQPPVEVQVVSLDWKWLFIYPAEHIATVNQLVIPVGRPVHFSLTSSGVFNSFFVPQLGSQIYAMASMTSQLSLQADHPGSYAGLSAMFSGPGFADMRFTVKAVPPAAYTAWTSATGANGNALDLKTYAALVDPSRNVPPATYRAVDPNLFASIVNGTAPQEHHPVSSGGQDQAAGGAK